MRMVRTSQNRNSKSRAAVLFVFISWTCVLAQIKPPGKLTSVRANGPVSFRYPQNWQILKQNGADDILIGPPDALASWSTWEQVETKKHRKEEEFVTHTMVSH